MNAIITLLEEGRLIRGDWTGKDAQGREAACLLAALAPETGKNGSATACPAEIMPAWLAYLTPWMDDTGTLEAWPGMVRRYADLADRWRVLTQEDWRQLDYTARRIAVEAALPHAGGATRAVEDVLALLRRAEAGESVSPAEWGAGAAAAAAAEAAEAAAAWAEARAAWAAGAAAARAAAGAAWAEARAARAAWAAGAAARAAAGAAWAEARAAGAAGAAARAEARAEAADRITAAILDAIEAKIIERGVV